MNLKLFKNTKITYFNVQKGAFSKGSVEQICPGQHLYVDLTIGHPWKNEVDRKMYWGFTFYIDITSTIIFIFPKKPINRKANGRWEPYCWRSFYRPAWKSNGILLLWPQWVGW